MSKFESKEEYERWKAEKVIKEQAVTEQAAKEQAAKKKSAWEQEALKREGREQADRKAREEASEKQADKQKTIPHPQGTTLSWFFDFLAIVSFIFGCIMAVSSWPDSYGNSQDIKKVISTFWFFSGVVEAAFLAFFAQCLSFLKGIYSNTYRQK